MKLEIKKVAFLLSLSVFVLPLLETQFRLFTFIPLKGAYIRKEKPLFNDSVWFNGYFQQPYEEYLNDTVGFRPLFIRIFNQLDYSLFNKLHAYDIVVGKNNSLQATTHYDAYLGKLNLPAKSVDSLSYKLKLLQDTLEKKNISLIFAFAPSKGSFSFSDAPYWYDTTKKDASWYEKYISAFKKLGITYIDLNKYFLNGKGKTVYPLYTKYGIHWSNIGSVYAFDTLCKFIEWKNHVKLPQITFRQPLEISEPYKVDIDLTPSLNLLYPIKFKEKFFAPNYIINSNMPFDKVKMMMISDSYFWNIAGLGIEEKIFDHYSFWYYYTTIYEKGINQSSTANSKDIGAEIEKHNVIVIMATFTNLNNPGWGFIDRAYEYYFEDMNRKVREIIEQIKNSKEWYNSVKEKALKNHIEIDKQLYADALYVYELRKKAKQ